MPSAALMTVLLILFIELAILYSLTVGEKMKLFSLYCPEATVMMATGIIGASRALRILLCVAFIFVCAQLVPCSRVSSSRSRTP